jgi:hypothetical protein
VPTLDGPVLVVLAATTAPLSLAEVHRRAGEGSKSGIRRVLLRLVSESVVHEVPGGYLLNREHLVAPAVELLANLYGDVTACSSFRRTAVSTMWTAWGSTSKRGRAILPRSSC